MLIKRHEREFCSQAESLKHLPFPLKFGTSSSSPLLLPIAQQPSEDLSRWRLWDSVEKFDAASDPFVPSFLAPNVLQDIVPQSLIAVRRCKSILRFNDVGLGNLASFIIQHRSYCTIGNCRVIEKASFEFRWCNLMSLALSISDLHP